MLGALRMRWERNREKVVPLPAIVISHPDNADPKARIWDYHQMMAIPIPTVKSQMYTFSVCEDN